ncbi:hypothetical protein CUJ83_04885 [Methanocella sp. CWC-04]|uniref:Zn-binding Pro-Ala-Ala-Arg (PAAR) domain-containing protein, incolved in TypeVI secretion n=1 Tax=Methanooceanicella nereidis TaxID=2052831 RepID=A0AAP2RBE3_9EURY|nr:PAAR domain-containing protein [Methanocella sp. CWC-04]MCD1294333.1 hypothetical protein [Methanocella sp. CWC-04]
MGLPAAKLGDKIVAMDTHIIITPSGAPSPVTLPFNGTINGNVSPNVMIEGKPAATVGSTAMNIPVHIPPGGSFSKPPMNMGTIQIGSATVMINGKPAARAGDTALTCNDPVDLPVGKVVAAGTVMIG